MNGALGVPCIRVTVCHSMHLSRERVRQIRASVLEQLRKEFKSRQLRRYLELEEEYSQAKKGAY